MCLENLLNYALLFATYRYEAEFFFSFLGFLNISEVLEYFANIFAHSHWQCQAHKMYRVFANVQISLPILSVERNRFPKKYNMLYLTLKLRRWGGGVKLTPLYRDFRRRSR